MLTILKTHKTFSAVFIASILLRIAFWLELKPALMFADSWIYLNDTRPITYLLYRPAGYVFFLAALQAEENLAWVTAIQHVAGLVTGLLVYDLCSRLGVWRPLSAIAAGIFLLNASTLTLEQYVLTESLFALTLVASVRYIVLYPERRAKLALSGLLLAIGMLLRGAAIFAVPFWLGWILLHNRLRWRTLIVAGTALLLPLVVYVGVRNSQTDYGTLTLHRGDGWFLYGRAMSFADCARLHLSPEVAPLCPDGKVANSPEWFVWSPDSPARTFYTDDKPEYNETVRSVALRIIANQPLDYFRAVVRDLVRAYFPGTEEDIDASVMIAFEGGPPYPFDIGWPAAQNIANKFGLEYRFPRVARESLVGWFWEYFRVPKLVLTVALTIGLVPAVRRRWRSTLAGRAAIFLALTALGMFGLAVATHTYEVRYQVPLVPLYASAGAIGTAAILGRDAGGESASPEVLDPGVTPR